MYIMIIAALGFLLLFFKPGQSLRDYQQRTPKLWYGHPMEYYIGKKELTHQHD